MTSTPTTRSTSRVLPEQSRQPAAEVPGDAGDQHHARHGDLRAACACGYFLLRRWTRVLRSSLRCFFLAIRLRRFLTTEPTVISFLRTDRSQQALRGHGATEPGRRATGQPTCGWARRPQPASTNESAEVVADGLLRDAERPADPDGGQLAGVHQAVDRHLRDPHERRPPRPPSGSSRPPRAAGSSRSSVLLHRSPIPTGTGRAPASPPAPRATRASGQRSDGCDGRGTAVTESSPVRWSPDRPLGPVTGGRMVSRGPGRARGAGRPPAGWPGSPGRRRRRGRSRSTSRSPSAGRPSVIGSGARPAGALAAT